MTTETKQQQTVTYPEAEELVLIAEPKDEDCTQYTTQDLSNSAPLREMKRQRESASLSAEQEPNNKV